jgi:hypothetical protein
VQVNLGKLGLDALTKVTLFLVTQQLVQGIQAALARLHLCAFLKLEVVCQDAKARTVEANAAEDLDCHVEKALVVDWTSKLQVTKVAWVRLVMQTAEAGIIGAAIERLAVDLSFMTSDTGRDLFAIDSDCLSDTVLSL